MSTWKELIIEQFPEYGHEPESWTSIDAAMELASLLERAARSQDQETCLRVLNYVLWAERQSVNEEDFTYFCQDVLRRTIQSPPLRSVFVSLLNRRNLAQLRGLIEYLSSKEVLTEIEQEVKYATRKA